MMPATDRTPTAVGRQPTAPLSTAAAAPLALLLTVFAAFTSAQEGPPEEHGGFRTAFYDDQDPSYLRMELRGKRLLQSDRDHKRIESPRVVLHERLKPRPNEPEAPARMEVVISAAFVDFFEDKRELVFPERCFLVARFHDAEGLVCETLTMEGLGMRVCSQSSPPPDKSRRLFCESEQPVRIEGEGVTITGQGLSGTLAPLDLTVHRLERCRLELDRGEGVWTAMPGSGFSGWTGVTELSAASLRWTRDAAAHLDHLELEGAVETRFLDVTGPSTGPAAEGKTQAPRNATITCDRARFDLNPRSGLLDRAHFEGQVVGRSFDAWGAVMAGFDGAELSARRTRQPLAALSPQPGSAITSHPHTRWDTVLDGALFFAQREAVADDPAATESAPKRFWRLSENHYHLESEHATLVDEQNRVKTVLKRSRLTHERPGVRVRMTESGDSTSLDDDNPPAVRGMSGGHLTMRGERGDDGRWRENWRVEAAADGAGTRERVALLWDGLSATGDRFTWETEERAARDEARLGRGRLDGPLAGELRLDLLAGLPRARDQAAALPVWRFESAGALEFDTSQTAIERRTRIRAQSLTLRGPDDHPDELRDLTLETAQSLTPTPAADTGASRARLVALECRGELHMSDPGGGQRLTLGDVRFRDREDAHPERREILRARGPISLRRALLTRPAREGKTP